MESESRQQVLARVRQAVGTSSSGREDDYASIPRPYRRSGTLGLDDRIEQLINRLHEYGAHVAICAPDQISATIADCLRGQQKRRLLIPNDLPLSWLPSGFEWLADEGLKYGEMDTVDGAITACAAAIAWTGSLVLRTGPGQGRRAVSLIPDYHLCIVFAEQIYETVPEAIEALEWQSTESLTFISGPSATSDIEMTRIKGVHGPRTLEAIVVKR